MHPDLPTLFEWKASTTEHFLQSYFQWHQDDFVFQWLSQHPNEAYSDTQMLRGRKLEDTVTFRRSRESDLELRHVLAVLMVPENHMGSSAVALYSDRRESFREADRRLLQDLTPAFSGGFQNFARFDALSAHNQLLEEMLRQEGANAIVLDTRRRECFRTGSVTSLLEKWYPGRSERDEGGIPRVWRARMDAFMAGSVLLTPIPDSWREERRMSALEVCFTRLPRIQGRDQWELRLREVNEIPESWRPKLSRREFEAAALVLQGKSDKDIAKAMAVALDTAKQYVQGAYDKLDAHGRAALRDLAKRS
jgi:DNA-binding CsgD family transcriptional regulator